jgi:hypothetical protein
LPGRTDDADSEHWRAFFLGGHAAVLSLNYLRRRVRAEGKAAGTSLSLWEENEMKRCSVLVVLVLAALLADHRCKAEKAAAPKGKDVSRRDGGDSDVSVECFAVQGKHLRHWYATAFFSCISSEQAARDARFKKVEGLADPSGISFESHNYAGQYLRHKGGRLILTKCLDAADKKDATFLISKGLVSDADGWLSACRCGLHSARLSCIASSPAGKKRRIAKAFAQGDSTSEAALQAQRHGPES